ncbi:MAG: hypothetical protein ACMUIU_11700 [bacterium]
MTPKKSLKERLMQEINKIPEDRFDSIYQILHCLRVEFTKKEGYKRKAFSDKFIHTFGNWQDKRSTDQIISDIYDSRFFSKKDIQW